MAPELRTADLIVLIVYMAGVFVIGCWFARKSGKPEGFMAAGRSLPGWAVGLSIFGTYVSSNGFLGNTGKAYGSTWNSWVFGLSLPIAAVIAVRRFIPLYRGSSEVSAYYHLEKRFGLWASTYALACYLLSQLARIGTILCFYESGIDSPKVRRNRGWAYANLTLARFNLEWVND